MTAIIVIVQLQAASNRFIFFGEVRGKQVRRKCNRKLVHGARHISQDGQMAHAPANVLLVPSEVIGDIWTTRENDSQRILSVLRTQM
jgi:hypothetical protein